jgi:hypothetical protein
VSGALANCRQVCSATKDNQRAHRGMLRAGLAPKDNPAKRLGQTVRWSPVQVFQWLALWWVPMLADQ